MSEQVFVALIRRAAAAWSDHVSTDASRRDIAGALAGLALGGGWAALHGGDDIDAKKKGKKKRKKRCKGDKKTCGKSCIPKGDCCRSTDCDEGELCAQGTCVVGLGSCEVGDDICVDNTATCGGGNCFCYRTMADETRCGSAGTLSEPGACSNDDDCQELFPDIPGAFCGKDVGPNCVNSGVCVGPCGFPD